MPRHNIRRSRQNASVKTTQTLRWIPIELQPDLFVKCVGTVVHGDPELALASLGAYWALTEPGETLRPERLEQPLNWKRLE
jgi:hypothetical protein